MKERGLWDTESIRMCTKQLSNARLVLRLCRGRMLLRVDMNVALLLMRLALLALQRLMLLLLLWL